jgi:hypothetical protein
MRKWFLALAAGTALAGAPTAANAIQFQGTATGCFGAGCTPGAYVFLGSAAPDNGLVYSYGQFNQNTDANGFLGLGGTTDNLGAFSLSSIPGHDYNGDVFNLLVTFTLPTATSPGTSLYSTMLQGIVTSGLNNGSVFIDFDNSLRSFTSAAGDFTFQVNDVSVSSNSAIQILSGQIQAVPEPATWAMMLLGFGGIGMAMRRRRQPVLAQVA